MKTHLYNVRLTLVICCFAALYFAPYWVAWHYIDRLTFEGYTLVAFIGFHILSLSFLIYQYWAGKRFALRAVDAYEIADPELEAMNEEIAAEMGIPAPRLMAGTFGEANAFAVGRRGNGTIVLSHIILDHFTQAEIKAIIAHELSHLHSRDTTVMLLGESLDYFIYAVKRATRHDIQSVPGLFVALIIFIIGSIIRACILLPLRAISRRREYIADADSARMTDAATASSALERVGKINSQADARQSIDAIQSLCIFRSRKSLTDRLFGTHPPLSRRISKLQSL